MKRPISGQFAVFTARARPLQIFHRYLLILALVTTVGTIASGARAASHSHDGAQTHDVLHFEAWSRATPGTVRTAAVFGTLTNPGLETVVVRPHEADVAEQIAIHDTALVDGVMRMRHQKEMVLAAGESMTLEPGGRHLMLTGLRKPLKRHDRFTVTLVVSAHHDGGSHENATTARHVTEVDVYDVGAMGPQGSETGPRGSATEKSGMDHQHH